MRVDSHFLNQGKQLLMKYRCMRLRWNLTPIPTTLIFGATLETNAQHYQGLRLCISRLRQLQSHLKVASLSAPPYLRREGDAWPAQMRRSLCSWKTRCCDLWLDDCSEYRFRNWAYCFLFSLNLNVHLLICTLAFSKSDQMNIKTVGYCYYLLTYLINVVYLRQNYRAFLLLDVNMISIIESPTA